MELLKAFELNLDPTGPLSLSCLAQFVNEGSPHSSLLTSPLNHIQSVSIR